MLPNGRVPRTTADQSGRRQVCHPQGGRLSTSAAVRLRSGRSRLSVWRVRDGERGSRRGRGDGDVHARLSALFGGGWVPPAAGQDASRDGEATATDRACAPRVWRFDPGRRGALAVLAAVAVTAALVGWRVLADQPQARAVPVTAHLAVASAGLRSGPAASSSAPARVVVDVVGKVRRPGIARLPTGSRVDDAVRAAGGAVPGADLSSLNLARVLVDGEQIAVGVPGAGGSAPSGANAGGSSPGPGVLVNLNTATVAQLDALPGVGPVLAQRIVDWRTTHGRFESVEQLNQVTGIGSAKFADIKPLVTV